MEIELDFLKRSELAEYKELIDTVLGESQPIEIYLNNYKENHTHLKVVVAKKDSKIIGTITIALIDGFTGFYDPRIEFFNFAVSKEARGTDASVQLMKFVENAALNFGYKTIGVNCFKDAQRAHAFYEKSGFERADTVRYVKILK